MAARFSGAGQSYEGLAYFRSERPIGSSQAFRRAAHWTGEVRLVSSALEIPFYWMKPRRVFVNSMSDLFHEKVPASYIDQIFAVMAIAGDHTFQVLTKRPERMKAYLSSPATPHRIELAAEAYWPGERVVWPLLNVWLGVSVENQATADQRIPFLLETPAPVRWVSYEPALGQANFRPWLMRSSSCCDAVGMQGDWCVCCDRPAKAKPRLGWIVVGGESGPGARPFCIDWADAIVRDCRFAKVPVFVKQLGAHPVTENANRWDLEAGIAYARGAAGAEYRLRDKKGGDMAEWPEELRVRQYPEVRP